MPRRRVGQAKADPGASRVQPHIYPSQTSQTQPAREGTKSAARSTEKDKQASKRTPTQKRSKGDAAIKMVGVRRSGRIQGLDAEAPEGLPVTERLSARLRTKSVAPGPARKTENLQDHCSVHSPPKRACSEKFKPSSQPSQQQTTEQPRTDAQQPKPNVQPEIKSHSNASSNSGDNLKQQQEEPAQSRLAAQQAQIEPIKSLKEYLDAVSEVESDPVPSWIAKLETAEESGALGFCSAEELQKSEMAPRQYPLSSLGMISSNYNKLLSMTERPVTTNNSAVMVSKVLQNGLNIRLALWQKPYKDDVWTGRIQEKLRSYQEAQQTDNQIQKLREIVGNALEAIEDESETTTQGELVEIFRRQLDRCWPELQQPTFTIEDFHRDLAICVEANEAVLQRTLMMKAIDVRQLSSRLKFTCESVWYIGNPHSFPVTAYEAVKMPMPKPDLTISFDISSITEGVGDHAAVHPELLQCICPDGISVFPFLFIEAKKGADSLAATMTTHMNAASHALHNIFKCMEKLNQQNTFHEKVRVFSISMNVDRLVARVYRALKPGEQCEEISFVYEEIMDCTHYGRDQLTGIVRSITQEYALGDDGLLQLLRKTYRDLCLAFMPNRVAPIAAALGAPAVDNAGVLVHGTETVQADTAREVGDADRNAQGMGGERIEGDGGHIHQSDSGRPEVLDTTSSKRGTKRSSDENLGQEEPRKRSTRAK